LIIQKITMTHLNKGNEKNKVMQRFDIINAIIEKNNQNSYLEIGVCNPNECFDKINCEYKDSVDPGYENPSNPVKFKMTSDDFFNQLSKQIKYDIIFIDGLHLSYQVKKDINNSLKHLSKGGYIIVHDCNPPSLFHARENYLVNGVTHQWNGTVWKAIYEIRTHRKDLNVKVVDTDYGMGIISYNEKNNTKLVEFDNPFYEYNKMSENRVRDLGLISIEDFNRWLIK